MKLARNIILYTLLLPGLLGCKKFVDIAPPVTQLTEANVYASDATAIATITGIYSILSSSMIGGNDGFSIIGGVAADEFTLFSGVSDIELIAHYQNNLVSTAAQSPGAGLWSVFYHYIF